MAESGEYVVDGEDITNELFLLFDNECVANLQLFNSAHLDARCTLHCQPKFAERSSAIRTLLCKNICLLVFVS